MTPHLFKAVLFAALQLTILAALRHACDTPPLPPSPPLAGAPGPLSLEQRVEAYLREQLYPVWIDHRPAFEILVSAPEGSGVLKAIAPSFVSGPDHYLAALLDKDDRLRNAPGRRLILVGGSGCAFGFDSPLISERYGLQPVNMGLHANLGIRFMLNHARSHVRDGDVVVVCFEYPAVLRDLETPDRKAVIGQMSPEIATCFDHAPSDNAADEQTEFTVAGRKIIEMKYFADKTALADAASAVRGYRDKLLAKLPAEEEEARDRREFEEVFQASREKLIAAFLEVQKLPLYRRTNFNEFGDFVGHRPSSEHLQPDLDQFTQWIPEALSPEQEQQALAHIALINEFGSQCTKRGATVLFCYPPLIQSPRSAEFAKHYSRFIEQHLAMPVLFPVEEMLYDADNFFDTENHLTWEGTCRRMTTLVTALDEHLEPSVDVSVAQQVADRNRAVRGAFARIATGEQRAVH